MSSPFVDPPHLNSPCEYPYQHWELDQTGHVQQRGLASVPDGDERTNRRQSRQSPCNADERERATREFQERLWEHNHVAAIGQGNISVDEAIDDKGFRQWLAGRSLQPLPPPGDARLQFLTGLYEDLKSKLEGLLTRHKTPHLKIFRVMAALYPEGMTTIAASGKINKLARAMRSEGRLDPVERHIFVRSRIDGVLGEAAPTPEAQAERMGLAWVLYARYVQDASEITESGTSIQSATSTGRTARCT